MKRSVRNSFSSVRVWLGQSVDTSSICAAYPELRHYGYLTSLGCAIRRPSLKKTHFQSNLRQKLGITGPLMIDSGGFALLKNPQSRWTARNVAELISRIDADIFVSLDYPPLAADTATERRSKIQRSHNNWILLRDISPDKIIMPVVHGRTMREIDLCLNLLSRVRAYPKWIGLGGIVPLLQQRYVGSEISEIGSEVFIAHALRAIRSAFPKTKIHAFGAGGTRSFPAVVSFGADSADSIGWRQAAGFGSIFLPLKSQRVVVWNGEGKIPRKQLDKDDLDHLVKCRCPSCRVHPSLNARLKMLRAHFHDRSIHNAWTIGNQFKFWPKNRADLREFVLRGGLGSRWAKAAAAAP